MPIFICLIHAQRNRANMNQVQKHDEKKSRQNKLFLTLQLKYTCFTNIF